MRALLTLSAVLLSVPASAADLTDRLVQAELAGDAWWDERDALVLDPAVTNEDLEAFATHPDWRLRMTAESILGWRQDAYLFDAVLRAEPRTNRAGQLRFFDPALRAPEAFPAIVERLLHGGEGPVLESALLVALVGLVPDWAEVSVGLLPEIEEPQLRAEVVGWLKKADPEFAHAGLRLGLTDEHPAVRAEAAITIGFRKDGAELADDLVAHLADEDASTRAMSARALGWLGVAEPLPAIVALVDDADPTVRLHALRAVRNLDVQQARALPQLGRLLRDADDKVARVARTLTD
jgi:HEAT repeat protein